MSTEPRVVADEAELAAAVRELRGRARVALDVESNGMFVYRQRVCTVQLASDGDVFVVDALAVGLDLLAPLLTADAPVKIVHDLAFDARMLAELGIALGACHDTALAARMLGTTSTGLASLLAGRLGVAIDKEMQSHDWGARPLDAEALTYLAADVAHLEALDDSIFGDVLARGIELEVREETSYRLASAAAAAKTPDPRPPFVRLKGIERATTTERAILRHLAALREETAARVDVPPHRVMAGEAMFAVARARPKSAGEVARVRGAPGRLDAADIARAVAAGLADGDVPDAERAWLDKPRAPAAAVRSRRAREARLIAWRKAQAAARGVDEQVVLPGHCLKDVADAPELDLDALARVPGIGAFRVAKDGEAIVRAAIGDGDAE